MAFGIQAASSQARQFLLTGNPVPSAPSFDEEAPPPYNTLPPEPRQIPQGGSCIAQTFATQREDVSHLEHTGIGQGSKLGYMDFVPRLLRKRRFKDDVYETFGELVERTNAWLGEHLWVRIITCETVIWSGVKTNKIFSDQSCCTRSLNASVKTKNLVGLRLWFEQDTFPSHQESQACQTNIDCKTFRPRHDQETFAQMIDRINVALEQSPFSDHIFSVEVVVLPCRGSAEYRPGLLDTELCYWKEDPEYDKIYAMCVRIYAKRNSARMRHCSQSIGYKDFVPEINDQSAENKGYEMQSTLIDRSSRWMASQQGVRFVSVRTVTTKLKKNLNFAERCVYTEHLCARNRGNVFTGLNSTTKYLTFIRTFYVVINTQVSTSDIKPPPGSNHSLDDSSQVRLTSRAFMPTPVNQVTASLPVSLHAASSYEEQRNVVERINQWFSISGARLFHIETVLMRQTSIPSQQCLGTEATFSQNCLRNSTSNTEKWVFYVRIYLDGIYREPPPAIALVVPSVRVP